MPSISLDSYIRLTLQELLETSFENVYNELDTDLVAELLDRGIPADRAGFSEWVSKTTPAIAIGFTFFTSPADPGVPIATPEKIRTNVMLTGIQGYDLGDVNNETLRLWLEFFPWKMAVAIALK